MEKLQVGGFLDNSLVNGKGLRAVLFLSGCKHKCPGCHNEGLQDFLYGEEVAIEEILKRIKRNIGILKGVTYSGGDPMEQPKALLTLTKEIKKLNLDIWCYTGYSYEELLKDEDKYNLLKEVDILVDGAFLADLKEEGLRYKGSSNQRVIDVQSSLKRNSIIEIEY